MYETSYYLAAWKYNWGLEGYMKKIKNAMNIAVKLHIYQYYDIYIYISAYKRNTGFLGDIFEDFKAARTMVTSTEPT